MRTSETTTQRDYNMLISLTICELQKITDLFECNTEMNVVHNPMGFYIFIQKLSYFSKLLD